MPGYGPHSFRKTLARLGQQACETPEQVKAWSQSDIANVGCAG